MLTLFLADVAPFRPDVRYQGDDTFWDDRDDRAVRDRIYHVYILCNDSRCLYVGVTGDLQRRIWRHQHGTRPAFTRRYEITSLVFTEPFTNVRAAIAREKQLKRWPRWRKDRLIELSNPGWIDLSVEWIGE